MNEIGQAEIHTHDPILGWKPLHQTQTSAEPPQLQHVSPTIRSLYLHLYCLSFYINNYTSLWKAVVLASLLFIKVIILYWPVSSICPFPLECRIQGWNWVCITQYRFLTANHIIWAATGTPLGCQIDKRFNPLSVSLLCFCVLFFFYI